RRQLVHDLDRAHSRGLDLVDDRELLLDLLLLGLELLHLVHGGLELLQLGLARGHERALVRDAGGHPGRDQDAQRDAGTRCDQQQHALLAHVRGAARLANREQVDSDHLSSPCRMPSPIAVHSAGPSSRIRSSSPALDPMSMRWNGSATSTAISSLSWKIRSSPGTRAAPPQSSTRSIRELAAVAR